MSPGKLSAGRNCIVSVTILRSMDLHFLYSTGRMTFILISISKLQLHCSFLPQAYVIERAQMI
jgi:hypothetical protein